MPNAPLDHRVLDVSAVIDPQHAVGKRSTSTFVRGAGSAGSPAEPTRIQRKGLISAATIRKAADDVDLLILADEVQAYREANGRKTKKKERPNDQERLVHIRSISSLLYVWYNKQDTTDLAALDSREADVVRRVEASLDAEHARLVNRIAKSGDKITSGDPHADLVGWKGDGVDVDAVWANLIAGTGRLQIVGPADFVKDTRSMLVRILATPIGARLLTRLSVSDDDQTVTIGGGDPPSDIKPLLYEKSASESKAIPQISDGGDGPVDRKKLSELTELIPVDPYDVNISDYPLYKEPIDLLRAAMDRRQGICIDLGDDLPQCLQFGPGAYGAYVALVDGPDGLDNSDVSGGRSVHTPNFVTLAHELGHALNQLAGTTTLDAELIFQLLGGDVGTFEDKGPQRKRWTNAEEFLIISGLENEIRKAVGLDARGGHAAVVDQALLDQLTAQRQLVKDFAGVILTADTTASAEKIVVSMMKLRNAQVKGLSLREKRSTCEKYRAELVYSARWVSRNKTLAAGVNQVLKTNPQILKQLKKHVPEVLEILPDVTG